MDTSNDYYRQYYYDIRHGKRSIPRHVQTKIDNWVEATAKELIKLDRALYSKLEKDYSNG